jgi:hypothetical protein
LNQRLPKLSEKLVHDVAALAPWESTHEMTRFNRQFAGDKEGDSVERRGVRPCLDAGVRPQLTDNTKPGTPHRPLAPITPTAIRLDEDKLETVRGGPCVGNRSYGEWHLDIANGPAIAQDLPAGDLETDP